MDGIDRMLLAIMLIGLFALSFIHDQEINEMKKHIAALEQEKGDE